MATTYTITVQSTVDGNKYFVDGVQQDSLTLEAGQTYVFDQSDASNTGHPLALSRTDNGTHGGGVEYTNGVVVTGTAGTDRVLTFTAPNNAPSSLYYYCQVHSGMGGSITVQNQTDNDPIRNFFKTLIVGEYSTTDTQFDVISTDAPSLPDPANEGEYNLTIFDGTDSATSEFFEIVRVTARSSNTLTVVRAQEGTTALDMQDPNHTFGVVYSATKKTFDDIKAEIDQAQLDITQNTSDISQLQSDVQNINVTTLTGVESLKFDTTGDEVFKMPVGTTVQRPTPTEAGFLRFNTDSGHVEINDGTGFRQLDYRQLSSSGVGADAIAEGQIAVADELTYPVEYIVVAGGAGGGGQQWNPGGSGGGGGAGGYRSSVAGEQTGGGGTLESVIEASGNTSYTVEVGAGGTRGSTSTPGGNGGNSTFATVTSTGGGGGASRFQTGINGGSGGGEGSPSDTGAGSGIAGQGYDGGRGGGSASGNNGGGGGGGASEVGAGGGTYGTSGVGGDGGDGIASSITGSSTYRAGGGGGGGQTGGSGGLGGGGNGGSNGQDGFPSSANTGGGGGGAGTADPRQGGVGGSGVVILRYPSNVSITIGAGLVGSETTVGANKVATITSGSGNVIFTGS